MSRNVRDLATIIWKNALKINEYDSCIHFANGEIFLTNKLILSQISFFKNIINDPAITLPKKEGIDVVLYVDEEHNYINEMTFSFFYERLKEMNLSHGLKLTLTEYLDQLNYILLLDYLTDPLERPNIFFENIKWNNMLWIGLLSINFQNLNMFFNESERYNGLQECIQILNYNLSDEMDRDVKKYFGNPRNKSLCPCLSCKGRNA